MANLSGFVKRLRDIMRNDAGINGDAQRIEQIAWMLFLKVYDAKEQDWEWDDEEYISIIPESCRWANWAHDDKTGKAMTGERLLDFVNNTLFPTLKKLPVDASTPIKKAIVQTTFADANNYMKDGVLLRQVLNVIDDLDLSDYEESHAFAEIYEAILKELQSAGSAGEFYTPRAVTEFMAHMIDPQIGEQMADFACGTGGFLTSWLSELKKKVRTTEDEYAYSHSIYGIEKKQFPYMLCITNMLLHDLDVPRVFHDNSLLRDILDYTEDDKFEVVLMNPPYGGNEKAEVKNHFPSDLASSETADLFLSVIMYRLKKNGRAAVILPDGFLFNIETTKVNIKRKLLSDFNLHTVIRLPGSVFSPYTPITTNILFFDNTGPTKETWFYRMDMPEGYKHFNKSNPMKPEHFAPVIKWWNNRQELIIDGYDKARKYTISQLVNEYGYDLNLCGFPHEEEEILPPLDLIQQYQEERASLNAVIDDTLADLRSELSDEQREERSRRVDGALTRLVAIDSSFPAEIHQSILWSAIQGKITTQNPKERVEPLLRGIHLSPVSEKEVYFEIPDNWKWCKIGDIFELTNGKAFKPTDWVKSGIPIVRIQNLNDKKAPFNYFQGEIEEKFILNGGELLFSWSGTPGTSFGAFIWEGGKAVLNQHIFIVKPKMPLDFLYAKHALNAELKVFIEKAHGGAGLKHITKKEFENCVFPVPPLAEQVRIVEKLEELLPLCERLK